MPEPSLCLRDQTQLPASAYTQKLSQPNEETQILAGESSPELESTWLQKGPARSPAAMGPELTVRETAPAWGVKDLSLESSSAS